MGAHVIIDARTRKVRASLEVSGEGTTIFAVDLIGDMWDDFEYFAEQSAHYESRGELQKRNRYMRAAIAFLFSHFDGVVSELFGALRKEYAFGSYLPRRPDFCSLKAKILSIQEFLAHKRGVDLPAIDISMKLVRDIVNHPSISKRPESTGANDALIYDGADVYAIAVEDLCTTARTIDQWLTAACEATGYQRFRDTKLLCEEFARALGTTAGPVRQF